MALAHCSGVFGKLQHPEKKVPLPRLWKGEKNPCGSKHTDQNWLVVSIQLKNISQNGNLPQVGMKIKDIWNHHLENVHCFVGRIRPKHDFRPTGRCVVWNCGWGKNVSLFFLGRLLHWFVLSYVSFIHVRIQDYICSPKMFGPSVYVESSRNRPSTPMKGNL